MKKMLVVLVIVAIAIFAVAIVKDQIIKSVVTAVATQVTGAPVHMDAFSLGILNQSLSIRGLKMYNPAGFPEGTLIDIDKINVACDLGAFFKKKIHLVNAEIILKEIGLEKNKEGKLNVDSLKVAKQDKKTKALPQEQMPMQID